MASKTAGLGLIRPAAHDPVDAATFNQDMTAIDAAIAALKERVAALEAPESSE